MSSVFKGIRKVFRKVVKVIKKIAPIVLAVGALVFTGGAALGFAPLAGGWGAAAASVSSALGATGTLGAALTGAITHAGTGALIGGIGAELSGGSFSKGAKSGAKMGAITGGLLSSYAHLKTPQAMRTPGIGDTVGSTIDASTGQVIEGGAKTFPMPNTQPGVGQALDAAGNVAAPTGGRGLLSSIGGFAKDNPEIVGGIVKGIGAGLMSGSEADAERDLLRERYRLVGENYSGSDPGTNYRGAAPGTSGQTPTERFDPNTYGAWEYVYAPAAGRIVRQPVAASG